MPPFAWILTSSYNQFLRIHELLLFVTYLAQQHLSHPMIQVYLSAVRHTQITTGKSWPTEAQTLNHVLKGVRQSSAITYQPRERFPYHDMSIYCFFKNLQWLQRHHDLGSLLSGLLWFAQSKWIYYIITQSLWSPKGPIIVRCCLGQPGISITYTGQYKAIKRRPVQERCKDIFGENRSWDGAPGPLFLFSDGKWLTR